MRKHFEHVTDYGFDTFFSYAEPGTMTRLPISTRFGSQRISTKLVEDHGNHMSKSRTISIRHLIYRQNSEARYSMPKLGIDNICLPGLNSTSQMLVLKHRQFLAHPVSERLLRSMVETVLPLRVTRSFADSQTVTAKQIPQVDICRLALLYARQHITR